MVIFSDECAALSDMAKTTACADMLNIDSDLLVGKLFRLFCWLSENRENGFFAEHEIGLIADKMRWKKSSKKLIEALCYTAPGEKAGFLVEAPGGFSVYGWDSYFIPVRRIQESEYKNRLKRNEHFEALMKASAALFSLCDFE